MEIKIRQFVKEDIPYKVEWINNSENNQFLHYNLPLNIEKTSAWFKSIQNREDRLDYTITYDDIPIGIIGLLNIDKVNKKAEYYVTLGETDFKGIGVAKKATELLLEEAYKIYNLNKVYLFTEVDNIPAQKLFEKSGFKKEGLLKEDIIYNKKKIDRYVYSFLATEFLGGK
ncbi:GNAT family N-acetyltransferase [Tetragenococcus halophilus]|uniref:GNAT family N-acetyltransferase n=1 Tax=Tetragenococcus halophilus TaxID=51669 RepID=UPI0025B0058E|nr:GNAT family protein [Tetragenococcus halophilus]WJS82347.1 GNAT family N-acetyltransferase [Tetragenococcus halophilus]